MKKNNALTFRNDAAAVLLVFFFIAVLILTGCSGKKPAEVSAGPGDTNATSPAAEPGAGTATAGDMKEASAADVTFRWKLEGDTLSGELEAPTTGWVAVGFDPSSMMKDANFIMGYVANGQVSVSDQFGVQLTQHRADTDLGGKNDVTAGTGSEENGTTKISFTMPLNSGDQYDKALAAGSHRIILAYGSADNFSSVHTKAAGTDVQF